MKKRILNVFNGKPAQFSIKVETLGDGSKKYTPVAKHEGWFSNWIPIVLINDRFEAMHYHSDTFKYSENDCMIYIQGYKRQLQEQSCNKVVKVEFCQEF